MTGRIDVVTIFPGYLAPLELSLVGKARAAGLLTVDVHDLRSWTNDRHRTVDDTPFGGGAGMVMRPDVWGQALDEVLAADVDAARTVLIPTPAGEPFTQAMAEELALLLCAGGQLALACGRYEGIDARVGEHYAHTSDVWVREVSIGDYVLNGGEVAALVNIRSRRAATTILIDRLPELRDYDLGEEEIRLGAALTLTEIERRLAGAVPLLDQMFPQFASRLIRNGATLGGNLGTGSPIGDAPPALLALDADLELVSATRRRRVPLADYFTGYRQSVRAADELISAVIIPRPLAPVTAFHKIAKRRFDDISSVAVAFAFEIADGVVRRARIGAGGVAATPIRATATEQALVGAPWQHETAQQAAEILGREGTPMSDHRASAQYRTAMLAQSLHKLYAQTQEVGA